MPITLDGTLGIDAPLGTSSVPSYGNTTNTNTGLYFPSSTTLGLSTNGTAALTIDASQNVGIGVTPSAFGSGFKALQMNGGSLMAYNGTNMYYLNNAYWDGTNYKYVTSSSATNYVQSSGIHTWSYAASGTAGNNITFTEAMRIDSSGNVGIGTSSPNAKLQVNSGTSVLANFVGNNANNYIQISDNNAASFATFGSISGGNWYAYSTGYGALYAGGAERMRITAGGALLLGVTSTGWPGPTYVINDTGAYTVKGTTGYFTTNLYYNAGWKYEVAGAGTYYSGASGAHLFGYAASGAAGAAASLVEAMRIDSSGNLLVGTTSTTPTNTSVQLKNGSVTANGYAGHNGTAGSTWGNAFNIYWTGSAAQLWIDSSNVGNISLTSDYRIKKNIETQTTSALNRINQLRPVTYTYTDNEQFSWKSDGVQREGFIAHELQEVIPSAVNGEKDAENQVQSLQLDALCSVLVKAIQELSAKVDAQAAEIAALKGTK